MQNGFNSPHRRRDLQGLHRSENRHRSRSLSRSSLSRSLTSLFPPSNFTHRPNTLGLFLLSDVDEFYGLCDPGTANPPVDLNSVCFCLPLYVSKLFSFTDIPIGYFLFLCKLSKLTFFLYLNLREKRIIK